MVLCLHNDTEIEARSCLRLIHLCVLFVYCMTGDHELVPIPHCHIAGVP